MKYYNEKDIQIGKRVSRVCLSVVGFSFISNFVDYIREGFYYRAAIQGIVIFIYLIIVFLSRKGIKLATLLSIYFEEVVFFIFVRIFPAIIVTALLGWLVTSLQIATPWKYIIGISTFLLTLLTTYLIIKKSRLYECLKEYVEYRLNKLY